MVSSIGLSSWYGHISSIDKVLSLLGLKTFMGHLNKI